MKYYITIVHILNSIPPAV